MKKITLLFLSFLFVLLLTANSSNHFKLYDSTFIHQLFEDANLHLKPQAEDLYPTIMSVNPKVYELLDDTLYLYIFESEAELIEASKELNVDELFSFRHSPYVYQLNNALMVYSPMSPVHVNFNEEIEELIANEKD